MAAERYLILTESNQDKELICLIENAFNPKSSISTPYGKVAAVEETGSFWDVITPKLMFAMMIPMSVLVVLFY